MIIDEAIGLSAVIINETVGDKINKANAAINYLNNINEAYDENNENVQNNAEIDEAKDRLTETDFTCQDMIVAANYFGMDMEITINRYECNVYGRKIYYEETLS